MTRLQLETRAFDFLQSAASGAGVGIVGQAEMRENLREGELKMFEMVANKHKDFFSTTAQLTETENVSTIDLPTNLYRILYLQRIAGNNASTNNPLFMQVVDHNVTSMSLARGGDWPFYRVGSTSFPMYYRMIGQKQIELIPPPLATTANALLLTYVYRPAQMAADADVPFQSTAGAGGSGKDNLSEFHDIIWMCAVEKALLKEESFAQMDRMIALRREREREMMDYLSQTQTHQPRYINVSPDEFDW